MPYYEAGSRQREKPAFFTFTIRRMKRLSFGSTLMGAGALLGVVIGVLGVVLPGGSLNWFFHAPSAVFGLPLSIALIASGAVVRRMEHDAPRMLTDEELTRLMHEADALSRLKLPTREPWREG